MRDKTFYTIVGVMAILYIIVYILNISKLADCDFSSEGKDFKCEVVHGIGVVVPPTSIITVWYGTD